MQTGYEHHIQKKVGQTSTNRILDKLHHSTSVETFEIIDVNHDLSLEKHQLREKPTHINHSTSGIYTKQTETHIFLHWTHIA